MDHLYECEAHQPIPISIYFVLILNCLFQSNMDWNRVMTEFLKG